MKIKYNQSVGILHIGILISISSCEEKAAKEAPPPEIQVINVIQKDVPIYDYFVGQVYGQEDVSINARVE
jgi:hypothetical protein